MKSVTLTLAITLFAFASFAFPLLDPLSIIDSALGTSFVTRNHPNNVAVALAAPPTDLFISEYVEGSASNKAIEIYNGTGSAINMDVGGYVLQLYSNGSATPSQSASSFGVTIPAGGVAVFAHGAAVLGIPPDFTSSAVINFSGDDALVLRKGGAAGPIVDVIGQIGVDPGAQWGTDPTSTQDNTLIRKSTICGGDTNGSDAFNPATEWDGFLIDTLSNLGSHTANCAETTPPTIISIDDGDADDSVTTGTTLNYTITFSEDIDAASVTAADFDNNGTAGVTIGTITETSPGVFTVQVTANSAGTLVLRIPIGAVIEDVAGNDLAVPVSDDTTVTVTSAAEPEISVTGGPLNFGNQSVNTTSSSQSITVTNTGTADLVLGTPTFTTGTQFAFASDPNGTTIAPAASTTISFTFTPTTVGVKSDTVSIVGNAPEPPPTVSMSGTGVVREIGVAPASMSFATQPVGSTSGTRSVTISNSGDASLSIGTLVKSGDNAGDFTITTNPSNTVIAPDGTAKLRVTFSPGGVGSRTAQISIPSNDSDEANVIVNLSGTGTAAVTPAPVKSMWIWGGAPNPVTDPPARANLISRASANGITDLYVSVYQPTPNSQTWLMYPTIEVAALVSAAHVVGLKVWYTSGDAPWQDQPCNSTASSYQRMQEVVAYNNFVAANERFDGVMLDVEPGGAFNLPSYANMHNCFRGILPAEVKLGTAINAFWHTPYRPTVEYPLGGEIKSPSEHIIDLPLDQIVVMGYRDNAGVTGGNGIIGLDEDEIAYATSIGKAGLVLAGLETKDLGVPAEEHVTFFEEGNLVLNSESALVASHFSASSGFGGFSIHAYGDLYLSGAGGWPIGPSAASASISGRVMDASGRAISSAKIVVSDFTGGTRFFYTNTFGYYRATGLEAGQTYVLSVSARRHTFAAPSQVVSLADNISGLNFTASR